MSKPPVVGTISDERFLIIAGAYRAGTTSLFTYLAAHPEVRPASFKEPAFFFSHTWDAEVPPFPPGREAAAYLSIFKRKRRGSTFLEATPNYLFDPGCPERIRAALPNARIIVLLREPVSRLVSWYKHSLFQARIDPATPFDDWVARQLDDRRPVAEIGYLEQSVRHGRYSEYLADFVEVFGRAHVHVGWFEDLREEPMTTVKAVSHFAGIDTTFYDTYRFQPENESMQFRWSRPYNAYIRACQAAVRSVRRSPSVRLRVEQSIYKLGPALLRATTEPAAPVSVSADTRARLVEYYRADLEPLTRIVGERPPWADEYAA